MKKAVALTMVCCFFVLFIVSCSSAPVEVSLWDTAVYNEDTELGIGVKTITVSVETPEKTITFTIHTDADVLGDALSEHNLVSGENGPYGLYIKTVNGIFADYDVNKRYWSLNKDGEYLATAADLTEISDGDKFSIVYSE